MSFKFSITLCFFLFKFFSVLISYAFRSSKYTTIHTYKNGGKWDPVRFHRGLPCLYYLPRQMFQQNRASLNEEIFNKSGEVLIFASFPVVTFRINLELSNLISLFTTISAKSVLCFLFCPTYLICFSNFLSVVVSFSSRSPLARHITSRIIWGRDWSVCLVQLVWPTPSLSSLLLTYRLKGKRYYYPDETLVNTLRYPASCWTASGMWTAKINQLVDSW